MPAAAPLQIILFRHPKDKETLPYEEAIVTCFQGGRGPSGYLATGEDLGIQLEVFSSKPSLTSSPPELLDSFSHTLTIVFADHALLNEAGEALWDWLAECWKHISASDGRHAMVVVSPEERTAREFSSKRAGFERIQLLHFQQLGEFAIRPAMFAMRLVHDCRLLLARALPPVNGQDLGKLRLFISHAKIDGIPLAHALKKQIDSMGWLQRFYDADDLPPGCDWQRELEAGVGSSLVVMLRTEVYDSRYWCQQEVLWADEYATPAVLVDARTALDHSASALPFERVPTVRIPDGNLVRILSLALREGLRFLYFMRRVHQMRESGEIPATAEVRVFCFPPGMAALLRACRFLNASGAKQKLIIYPDPPLRGGLYEAAEALVEKYSPDAKLITPNKIAALGGKLS